MFVDTHYDIIQRKYYLRILASHLSLLLISLCPGDANLVENLCKLFDENWARINLFYKKKQKNSWITESRIQDWTVLLLQVCWPWWRSFVGKCNSETAFSLQWKGTVTATGGDFWPTAVFATNITSECYCLGWLSRPRMAGWRQGRTSSNDKWAGKHRHELPPSAPWAILRSLELGGFWHLAPWLCIIRKDTRSRRGRRQTLRRECKQKSART